MEAHTLVETGLGCITLHHDDVIGYVLVLLHPIQLGWLRNEWC